MELDVSHEEAEIRSLIANYERALNTGDATLLAVGARYAADALMMAAGQPTVAGPDTWTPTGRASASSAWRWSSPSTTLIERTRSGLRADPQHGPPDHRRDWRAERPESNREVFIFGIEDGAWKIRRYLFNTPQ